MWGDTTWETKKKEKRKKISIPSPWKEKKRYIRDKREREEKKVGKRGIDFYLFVYAGRIPFAFLEDLHERFVRNYGHAIHSAQAYAMNDEFSRVLSQQMDYYSNDPNADKINHLKGEMNQVMNENYESFYMEY